MIMNITTLKVKPVSFESISDGKKKACVVRFDKSYKFNDYIRFIENTECDGITGREVDAIITHIEIVTPGFLLVSFDLI